MECLQEFMIAQKIPELAESVVGVLCLNYKEVTKRDHTEEHRGLIKASKAERQKALGF